MSPSDATSALTTLADSIRDDETLLSGHLREPTSGAELGALAAAGPRAQGAEADYAFVMEAVREGYLLHYGEPRILAGVDEDLALLAGDHLYALGLECLAGLGDLEAVRELSDLISLSAAVHADGAGFPSAAGALWLGAATAVAAGSSPAYESAKASLREQGPDADSASAFASAATEAAAEAGITSALIGAADAIDFALDLPEPPASG